MRAFRLNSFDHAPKVETIDSPRAGPGQVAVQILACGLNFADMLMVKGTYQDTPDVPFTLGMEVCGIVVARGDGVTSPAVGDRIAVFGGQGGLAEVGLFPADLCRKVPDSMPDTIAAGFQVAYGTSHIALTRRARLKAGETLLVLGASGGVGLTAVEIGHALGARVIAVARGSEKLKVAQAAGADHLIDSDAGDLTQRLKSLGGVDVVYDPVGGDGFKAALSACNPEARILAIGFASGDIPRPPANILLVKNVDLIGFYWGAYLKFAPEILTESLAELMQWFVDGRLKPHISHILPLDRTAEALELLATRRATGKVVVTP